MRVTKTLQISTGDISFADCTLMDAKSTCVKVSNGIMVRRDCVLIDENRLPCVMQNEYGYLVAVLENEDCSRFSQKFQQIYQAAKDAGIEYIHIDRDEETEGELDPSWL